MSGWVLVTGAARRIGRAIALELADHGWDVIVHYNTSEEEAADVAEQIIAKGRKAVLAEINLENRDLVRQLIPSIASQLGSLSGLVNNASLFELDKDDPTGTRHNIINAEAPVILSESFCAHIPVGKTGSIVNIIDGVPPDANLSHYAKSKTKLRAATLAMAKNFAPKVRVNGIDPGPILANVRQTDQHFLEQVETTALKTCISPKDIAHAAQFLLSSHAITGHIIPIDAGLHLLTNI